MNKTALIGLSLMLLVIWIIVMDILLKVTKITTDLSLYPFIFFSAFFFIFGFIIVFYGVKDE